ncbi:MAG TPA: ATP synthase F1 subunit delta [Candidatus Ozemobacteraceae bacterium]
MKALVVARRYAEAFLKALGESQLDAGVAGFRAFIEAGKIDPRLPELMCRPDVAIGRKVELVNALFPPGTAPLTAEFLGTLLRRHRFDLLPSIAEEVDRQYNIIKNITCVHVRSAVTLTPAERERLTKALSRRVRGTVILHETVEPSMMGGLILRFEDRVLDTSLRTSLKNLRERLAALGHTLLNPDAPAAPAA